MLIEPALDRLEIISIELPLYLPVIRRRRLFARDDPDSVPLSFAPVSSAVPSALPETEAQCSTDVASPASKHKMPAKCSEANLKPFF